MAILAYSSAFRTLVLKNYSHNKLVIMRLLILKDTAFISCNSCVYKIAFPSNSGHGSIATMLLAHSNNLNVL